MLATFVGGELPQIDSDNKWKTSLVSHYSKLFLSTNSNLPLQILDKMKQVVKIDILKILDAHPNREFHYLGIQQVMVLYGYLICEDDKASFSDTASNGNQNNFDSKGTLKG
jgi:hypothetical protein